MFDAHYELLGQGGQAASAQFGQAQSEVRPGADQR
jgi:hypothetical protein